MPPYRDGCLVELLGMQPHWRLDLAAKSSIWAGHLAKPPRLTLWHTFQLAALAIVEALSNSRACGHVKHLSLRLCRAIEVFILRPCQAFKLAALQNFWSFLLCLTSLLPWHASELAYWRAYQGDDLAALACFRACILASLRACCLIELSSLRPCQAFKLATPSLLAALLSFRALLPDSSPAPPAPCGTNRPMRAALQGFKAIALTSEWNSVIFWWTVIMYDPPSRFHCTERGGKQRFVFGNQ